MFEKPIAGGSETPWGQSWASLLASLRPTASENGVLDSVTARVAAALRAADVPARVMSGGAFGKGTHLRGQPSRVEMYAVFDDFSAGDYFEKHLRPLLDAVSAARDPAFAGVADRGLAVEFCMEGVEVRLFAAGVLYGGPKDLLLADTAPGPVLESLRRPGGNGAVAAGAADVREIHCETTAAVLRVDLIRSQCPMYKDMVRVAKKWRDGYDFSVAEARPGDYLLELLMLEAFQGAPAARPSADQYAAIFRRFLALICTEPSTGSDTRASSDMPRTFLSWTWYYNRGTIDHCLAAGLLPMQRRGHPDGTALIIVDPAVPYLNVAATVDEWGEARSYARESLASFQNTEMVEVLDARLKNFSESVEKTLTVLRDKLEILEGVDKAPRRFAGQVQFRDMHLSSDAWVPVLEMELRCLTWILHARRPRVESTGYHQSVDVSLQLVGGTERQLDVDVSFRGVVCQVRFDSNTDHVLIARRSEVMRNRDYALQVTVVS